MCVAERLWFPSDFGETDETSVFPMKEKGLLSGSTQDSPGHPQKLKAGGSLSIDWEGPESLMWILPSVVLGSALHHGKPLCLTRLYLLIFFCSSKFTVTFIYVYFFFLVIFYEPAGPRHAEEWKPNTPLVWMPNCYFWCLAVNRCPKNDLQMLKRRIFF